MSMFQKGVDTMKYLMLEWVQHKQNGGFDNMKVGYVRVSTIEQNLERQETTMARLGVEKLFSDKTSAKNAERAGLKEMLSFVREGDIVIVDSYSRLARNTSDLLNIVEELTKRGVVFISNKEKCDTSTPSGKLMLTIFGALYQFERENMLIAQKEGIAEAKKQGKFQGRERVAFDTDIFKKEVKRWRNGEITARECMKIVGLKPNTFYRRVADLGGDAE